jgi:cell division septal protein FtsQ
VRRLYRAVGLILIVIAIAFVFQRLFGNRSMTPHLVSSRPVAVIGVGSDAVAVAADGSVLLWLPTPEEGTLPQLPLASVPKGGQLQGPALEQVHVLAAAPAGLRPYVEGSYYGESGVDVNLTSGVELRFGNDTQASRKWKAAAAVLADPTVTVLDYVDLHAPSRPAFGGSGHTLPPPP